ncbi:MAG: metal ABC transporter permease [Bacteroidales bacterium]|nr:metal ABC transporter permease [Bacteroidales bacterium]
MLELLKYAFFQHALLGGILVSIACGMVGTYIVMRRLVFISGGITHASFGGIGLGVFLGTNPIVVAWIFAIASAFGVEYLSTKHKLREDSAIAVLWALGMALGIIFLYLTPGYTIGMSEFLFGNILTISTADIYLFAGLVVALFIAFTVLYRPILYVAFDPEYARVLKLPVKFIEYMMMFFVATTIVFSIRLVGIVLLMSLVTIPQITADLFTHDFRKMMFFSVLIAVVGCVSGLLISYFLNVPSGAFIILVLISIYGLSWTLKILLNKQPAK